jgi:hypothetical protein
MTLPLYSMEIALQGLVGLDSVEKRKILLCGESKPGPPASAPSLYQLSYKQFAEIKFNSNASVNIYSHVFL